MKVVQKNAVISFHGKGGPYRVLPRFISSLPPVSAFGQFPMGAQSPPITDKPSRTEAQGMCDLVSPDLPHH